MADASMVEKRKKKNQEEKRPLSPLHQYLLQQAFPTQEKNLSVSRPP
jgi:hypothetical protein